MSFFWRLTDLPDYNNVHFRDQRYVELANEYPYATDQEILARIAMEKERLAADLEITELTLYVLVGVLAIFVALTML